MSKLSKFFLLLPIAYVLLSSAFGIQSPKLAELRDNYPLLLETIGITAIKSKEEDE
ncbi:hypothetical protein IQ230_09660 [Gloeocapsopsis crepidinum LEGE 06123]|uniref:Uncharacterized protein n=1 Tax=Gloeocapsopsis crepidinum LEGE 06123 TaxID=588587 RepID=A0ABR9UQR9_9CHRO|nr:hypothetical protein [Gloeocapsopsis crepidinum]MBE9190622.1 hypothetical protein [Gloeocapsopsis crepidinum LEGE 06123]